METQRFCPNCRKPLPPDVPLGLCPECLIKSGFPTESGGVSGETAGARFVPPSIGEIAQLFPQLEILRLIGKGGMGAVYKARQPALDRFVALKVLPPAVASDPGFAERFNREARALARLNHPNIVAVHDFGQAGSLHYLVMEFVDGTNLREVERAGELTSEQALAIVPQICEALQFAHNEGIVHRDIKPENLLLDKKGRLKITDFGIAKMVGIGLASQTLTGAKDVVGTPHYMAPEQIEKPQTVDHRADIYSLGVVFYEMLTGELPLGKFAAPSKKVQIDVRLDELVLHTLEKEPSRRYQQISQVKTDVETIAGTAGTAGKSGAASSAFPFQAGQTNSDKAILPALLLAFPFGLFGAHRFYVGKTGTAFLQLGALAGCILLIVACAAGAPQPLTGLLLGFLILGCFIWAVTDWILILCKAFTDGQGRRMIQWLHPQNGHLKAGASPVTGPPSSPPPGGTPPATGPGSPPPPMTPKAASAAGTGMIVAPAVGLIVAAIWKLFSALMAWFFLAGVFTDSWLGNLKDFGIGSFSHWGALAGFSILLFKVVPALLILVGAFQMLRLRSYAWALTAAILSLVACSLIGLPMGIWALIVLARPDVRETFANAARSESPKTNLWPWALGTALVAGLFILIALGLKLAGETRDVTVNGIVTDAVTGQPIAGARVDDNRYGAGPDEAPAQSWTGADGRYELNTRYEEHTIAASASGYESKLSTLYTKTFGSERKVSMNFRLQPESRTSPSIAASEEKTDGSSPKENAMQVPSVPPTPAALPVPPMPAGPPSAISMATNTAVAPVFPPVRIKAGSFKSFVDHDGNLWLPDRGFADGETTERPHLAIVNTKDPELYRTERYGMTSFSYPVPNGPYVVKLHFAETYDAITGPGGRVFTFVVEGREFKNFDIWAEAGGAQRACVKTVNVEVRDGKLNINFIPRQQNTAINGIEILPASSAGAAAEMPPPPQATKIPGDPTLNHEKIIGNLSTTDPFQQDFNETLPLSAQGRFHVDNVNGRIEIAGWDRNEVVVKALKHGKTRESVETTKIKVDASADEISIHTEGPPNESGFPEIWSWFKTGENNKATVDYAVQVPRHARLATIASVNGRVGIDDVGGDIEASTVNGTVEVQHVAGSLKLSTVNGRIDTKLVSLGGDQSVSLSTVNGSIEATLPANADAEVTADTVNGGMSSEFPALVVKKEFPLSKHLKGALGNGGATVKATTVNGSIRFRRGNDAP